MFETTVDGILKGLASGVEKLVALAEKKNGEASGHTEKVAEYVTKANKANAEAVRARRVAEKVKALLD